MRRIVSFLPSATEMTCALGLGEQLVGVTHECDYPPEVATKPVVVRNVLPIESMSQAEIDTAVAKRIGEGMSLYQVDERLLADLAPDLILTQNLCQVCAPSGNEVSQALKLLPNAPEILWMTPRTIAEIWENLRELGEATGRSEIAEELIAKGQAKLNLIASQTSSLRSRPRVFCMEWLDPVYASGHWVPEMVGIAGGEDALGRMGEDSVRIPWSDILDWAPEVLVVTPCGFNLEQTIEQAVSFFSQASSSTPVQDLPAVKEGRVFAVDANSYFARPGPRVVEGTELLAHLIHPEVFDWTGPKAFERLEI
jgi:iron complex transport system substrate-binding protein